MRKNNVSRPVSELVKEVLDTISLEVDSAKALLSRPTHQRVTPAVRRLNASDGKDSNCRLYLIFA
jgi:hypothetical protein